MCMRLLSQAGRQVEGLRDPFNNGSSSGSVARDTHCCYRVARDGVVSCRPLRDGCDSVCGVDALVLVVAMREGGYWFG